MDSTAQGATHVGRVREQNEDAYLVDDALGLNVVADGMGGHACGEVASAMTVTALRETLAEGRGLLEAYATAGAGAETTDVLALMRHAMSRASRTVYDESERDPSKRGMGTTCSALVLVGETAFLAHVGDSRVYLARDGRVVQLTRDHTLMNQLLEEGRLTRADAAADHYAPYRNALSRAVGVRPEVRCDASAMDVLPGDIFVIASDGLTRYVNDSELCSLLRDADEQTAEDLVELANKRGGVDNITVIVTRVAGAVKRRAEEFDETMAAFRHVPLFRNLSKAQTLHVLSVARTRTIPGGAVLSGRDSGTDALLAILSGGVRFERDGQTAIVLGPGETFGDLAAEGPPADYARAIATTDSRLLRLARRDIEEILGKAPEMRARLRRVLRADAVAALDVVAG